MKKSLKEIMKEFDKEFHKRMWGIVKLASPSSYDIAETYGLLEEDGPQIYGEMKAFLRKALREYCEGMLPEKYDGWSNFGKRNFQKEEGYNQAIDDMKAKLEEDKI